MIEAQSELKQGRLSGQRLAARLTPNRMPLLELSAHDSGTVAKALLNPAPVNDRLRDTVRRCREAAGVWSIGRKIGSFWRRHSPLAVIPGPRSGTRNPEMGCWQAG